MNINNFKIRVLRYWQPRNTTFLAMCVRENVKKLIPKGRYALLKDVVNSVNVPNKNDKAKHAYVRSVISHWLIRHNNRLFVKIPDNHY